MSPLYWFSFEIVNVLRLVLLGFFFGWECVVFFFISGRVFKEHVLNTSTMKQCRCKRRSQKCRIIWIWKYFSIYLVVSLQQGNCPAQKCSGGLYRNRNYDLFLLQICHWNILALDLNSWASRDSGCRSSSWCGRGGVQPCPLVLTWHLQVAAGSARGPLCHPTWAQPASLPPLVSSGQQHITPSTLKTNKQIKSPLQRYVKVFKLIFSACSVCWWSKWFLDELMLLVLLLS